MTQQMRSTSRCRSRSEKMLKKHLCAIFTVAYMISAVAVAEPNSEAQSPAAVMRDLRLRWLTERPITKQIGEETRRSPKPDRISAVPMDWPFHDQLATWVASSGGDASLYTTPGFGIIGGIGHEN